MPFILGGILGLLAVYLRRRLHETPVFKAMEARQRSERSLPVAIVLKHHLGAVFLSAAATFTLAAIVGVVVLMAPNLIHKLDGTSTLTAFYATDITTLSLVVSVTVTGILVDRFGTRLAAAVLSPILIAAVYALFSTSAASPQVLLTLSLIAGLAGGLLTVMPVIMVRGFPPSVRFTGVSFSYNVAYAVIGGLSPVIVQAWAMKDRLGPAHYVAACVAIGLVAALINRTTRMSSDMDRVRSGRRSQAGV
jgi:MFS family permease